jgi:hypothetical protein
MAGIIVDMSKIKQMLQLSEAGHSNRKIALELGINKETVNNYMQLIRNGRLDIRQLLKMDDPELERRFHAGQSCLYRQPDENVPGRTSCDEGLTVPETRHPFSGMAGIYRASS